MAARSPPRLTAPDQAGGDRPRATVAGSRITGALHTAVGSGRALYAAISNYPAEQHREAVAILRELGVPVLLNQARYSILDRTPEDGLLDAVGDTGTGLIAHSPLAQGLLADRYLAAEVPAGSRMSVGHFLKEEALTDAKLAQLRGLGELAERRGQSLSHLAISWVLRDPRVVSVIIGASSVDQLDQNLDALHGGPLSEEDLAEIDALSR
ncbi:aldo/keto reductase [Streptomyces sp. NPDC059558]|uniref:aldo/keto reductase n=1 Tax=Streptomyces sp. NPDC059558 TaxID=3346864 RepID=UPI0036A1D771